MRRLLSSFVVVFAALLFLPSDVQRTGGHRRCRQRLDGRRASRRHGRSGQPRAHRASAQRRHRRRRPVPHPRSPPGTYDVTFTITGFKTIRRTGIMLEGNFTAPVNADLAARRARTKPSRSPANRRSSTSSATAQTVVVNRDMLDAIPTVDAQPAGARQSDSRHDGDAGRLGPDQHDHLRIAVRRSGRDGRRHAPQPARRARGSSAASISTTAWRRRSRTTPARRTPKSRRAACAST